jgi:RES domain-containing protein
MRLWRISNHADLLGAGGMRAGARWHSAGHPVVYCSEHPALALLERLAHLEIDDANDLPTTYKLLMIEFSEEVATGVLDIATLPPDWSRNVPLTRTIGDNWLARKETALLAVPSVVAPFSTNYLLNPAHPDAARIRIAKTEDFSFDQRLFKFNRAD